MSSDNNIDSRVTALETAVENVTNQLSGLSTRLDEKFSKLDGTLSRLYSRQEESTKTNWGTLAAWAGVILIIAGLVIYQPLTEMRMGFFDHARDGHPTTVKERVDLVNGMHEFRLEKLEYWKTQSELWMEKHGEKNAKFEERILDIEREIYSGAAYRAGRPIKPGITPSK